MEKKPCESCRKVPATVRFHKDGGVLWYWYCEKCFADGVGTTPLNGITWNRQGFPEINYPVPPIFMLQSPGEHLDLPPKGGRGSSNNWERVRRIFEDQSARKAKI